MNKNKGIGKFYYNHPVLAIVLAAVGVWIMLNVVLGSALSIAGIEQLPEKAAYILTISFLIFVFVFIAVIAIKKSKAYKQVNKKIMKFLWLFCAVFCICFSTILGIAMILKEF